MWLQLRPAILGAVDGTITSFAVIATGFAGAVSKHSVLVIGFGSLFADAVSMASGEYLSVRGEGLPWVCAMRNGIVCGVAFVAAGCLPLLIYALMPSGVLAVLLTCCGFFACLVAIGLTRASFSTDGGHYSRDIIEVCGVGAAAGAVAVAAGLIGRGAEA